MLGGCIKMASGIKLFVEFWIFRFQFFAPLLVPAIQQSLKFRLKFGITEIMFFAKRIFRVPAACHSGLLAKRAVEQVEVHGVNARFTMAIPRNEVIQLFVGVRHLLRQYRPLPRGIRKPARPEPESGMRGAAGAGGGLLFESLPSSGDSSSF